MRGRWVKLAERTQTDIHSRGFDLSDYSRQDDYGKVKVGVKTLNDAILDLGSLKTTSAQKRLVDKKMVLDALVKNDVKKLREISEFFYNTNGIYSRICNYFAFLYRYDWYIATDIKDPKFYSTDEEVTDEFSTEIVKQFKTVINFLDNSYIKKICGEIALEVVKKGCYYGYILPSSTGLILQQLPVEYCRSRYFIAGMPAIEFNMAFFDEKFSDVNQRINVLNLFPDEFKKGYILYKKGKLKDERGMTCGWYLLTPGATVKFNFNNNDVPLFVTAIPAILDLDAAQDLDHRKQMQQLLKIIVQKLPRDKNGDLIFDVDEARDIHNNAVQMLKRAIGVDVLTTFADIESVNMSDRNSTITTDDLKRAERTVFNSFGVSQNLFNTDGNMSLEKSILNDESTVRNLILQFQVFFDKVTAAHNTKRNKYQFKFYMLETTQYNYKELSKMYKEQTQLGYSKMLPQIALGHSQSSIINTAFFENKVLSLNTIMIPPLMSSTLNGEDILGTNNKTEQNKNQDNIEGKKTNSKTQVINTEEKKGGRPEKPDDQKSDKTIANKESMS